MEKVVLASNNPGKLREFNQLLQAVGLQAVPQGEYSVPEVEETGLSFVENAILKARAASQHTGLPALADDSGIEVDALHGAPGIYSARFAGPGASDADNLHKLLQELKGVPPAQRGARFRCVIAFLRHATDPTPLISIGTWEGVILGAPQGDNGFGYDPVFYVSSEGHSAAELSATTKNRLSHRGQALQGLLNGLRQLGLHHP